MVLAPPSPLPEAPAEPWDDAACFPTGGPALTLHALDTIADIPDEQLMLAYAAGDTSAFETLYGRHRGPLYRFMLRQ